MFEGAKRYFVEDLELGMYICELDRPWTDTPFIYQGFFLDTEEQVEEIRKYCKYVFVDVLKQRESVPGLRPMPSPRKKRGTDSKSRKIGKTRHSEEDLPEVYPVQHGVEQELGAAERAHSVADKALQGIIADIKNKRVPLLTHMRDAVSGMVESVIRNPNAMVWLARLKDLDTYTYAHTIDVCAYLLVFGRHLGLPKDDLRVLGLGGVLMDVGKTKVPLPLLQKRTHLTDSEYELARRHVDLGLEIVRSMKNVPKRAIEMVHQHHERYDGSGYPQRLVGNDTSVFARMAAIADTFDAISSERPYSTALSSHEALRKLYSWADVLFHKGLVEQFIECLGIYPVGTLVELNTGEVAIVLAQNRFRQLKPRLVLILDKEKQPHGTMDVLDLIEDPVDDSGIPTEIARALEPGMYGVEPREFYL